MRFWDVAALSQTVITDYHCQGDCGLRPEQNNTSNLFDNVGRARTLSENDGEGVDSGTPSTGPFQQGLVNGRRSKVETLWSESFVAGVGADCF